MNVDHVAANRDTWEGELAQRFAGRARRLWAEPEPVWGNWNIPQSRLPVFPSDVAGQLAIELGCGTAYVSAWLARRGARPIGVDMSTRQLATAQLMQAEFGLPFPLLQADAEAVPLADGCADLVISEFGAGAFCDPYRWVPEAARLLRAGGLLVFMASATMLSLCLPDAGPASDKLVRDLVAVRQLSWPDRFGVEFFQSHGERIRLLRTCGLVVEDLIEVVAPANADTDLASTVPADWARRWPAEEVWVARRQG